MNSIIINKKYIEKYREDNNLSLNQLAKEIGISPSTLSRILSDDRNPGQIVIGRMLNYFGVSFDKLFSYDLMLTKGNE